MAVDYTIEDVWTLPGNNAVDGRYHDGAFLALSGPSGAPLTGYREGVLPSSWNGITYYDLQVVPDSPTPGMAIRCNLGQAVISRSGQGPYVATLRSTGRADLDASSTTNARRDLVVMQVLDASIGDADTRGRLWRVTGTPSGTPVLPSLPLGAIPLADVAVAANATQITAANITDLRRAAGIRGAVRLMMPGDSHADSGIYPGDARYCRTHQQVEVWKADAVWHGTVPLTYSTRTVVTTLTTTSISAAQVAIPDPGWPYRLEADGALMWTQGITTRYDLALRLDSTLGTLMGQTPGVTNGTGGLMTDLRLAVHGTSDATLTGAHSVHLSLVKQAGDPGAGAFAQNNANYQLLTVNVIPV